MWLILLFLVVGTVAGFLLRKLRNFSKAADQVTTYIIYLLLFIMGLRVGSDREIMDHIDTIGFQSFLIALFAIAGSVVLSKITYHYFFRNEK